MDEDVTWLSDEQQAVWRRWVTLMSVVPAVLHRDLQTEAGLSLPDFDVLVHLTEAPGQRVRITDLARSLAWERSRVSHHVTRMERRGLVSRQVCPEDGRGALVVLTEEGRLANERAAPSHVASVRRVLFDPLDDADLPVLGALLDKVAGALETTCDGADPGDDGDDAGACGTDLASA